MRRFFASDGDADPSWALDDGASIFVIIPGHTVVSRYAVSRGKYLAVCFWPDDEDGTPHAAMGMFGFVHVR